MINLMNKVAFACKTEKKLKTKEHKSPKERQKQK